MVEIKREILFGTILMLLIFSLGFIIIPAYYVSVSGEPITGFEFRRVFELSYLINFLIILLISVFSTKSRVDFLKRSYRFFIIETIIYEVFFFLMTPGLGLIVFSIPFSMIALIFGVRGIILQEDEDARRDWETKKAFLKIGSTIMVINIIIISIYLIFYIFIPYFSGLPIEKLD